MEFIQLDNSEKNMSTRIQISQPQVMGPLKNLKERKSLHHE